MQRNCGGVNTDGHGTNALKCVGKFVREPNRTKRRCVKYAASPQGFLLSVIKAWFLERKIRF